MTRRKWRRFVRGQTEMVRRWLHWQRNLELMGVYDAETAVTYPDTSSGSDAEPGCPVVDCSSFIGGPACVVCPIPFPRYSEKWLQAYLGDRARTV